MQDEDENGGGDDIESQKPLLVTNVATLGGAIVDWAKWKLKYEFFFFFFLFLFQILINTHVVIKRD